MFNSLIRHCMTATDQLQAWLYAHKSRSVSISHDDGYGGSNGWDVELRGNGKKVQAVGWGTQTETEDHVVAREAGGEDDPQDLDAVILAALQFAERKGL